MPTHHVRSAPAAGKERRFRRLFRADGRSVMVAMDHGGFQGYGPPLADAAGPGHAALDVVVARLHGLAADRLDVVFTQALAEGDREIIEGGDLDDDIGTEHDLGSTLRGHVGRIRNREHGDAVDR